MCLKCPYPAASLTSGSSRKRRQTQQEALSLDVDGVIGVTNLAQVDIVPDPVYEKFQCSERVYNGEALILNGTNLDLACSKDDVVVMIGRATCTIVSLDTGKLICIPPEKQPNGVSNSLPLVKVIVGKLEYELGGVRYETGTNSLMLTIATVVGGIAFLTIVIIGVILLTKMRPTAERQDEEIRRRLSTLAKMARMKQKSDSSICDLLFFTRPNNFSLRNNSMFVKLLLFANHTDHPILSRVHVHGGQDESLEEFKVLLRTEHFLIHFITAIEQHGKLCEREISEMASVLTMVLLQRADSAPKVLRAVLNILVDQAVESGNPRMLLRRSATVLEKLVNNWLSLNMLAYIKQFTGRPLWRLYEAIKQQTEKGPIDCMTSHARYSLSGDSLLKQDIDGKPLNIEIHIDPTERHQTVMCMLLDCDTISQAKAKVLDTVYGNTPYCRRPLLKNVNLEYRGGALCDIDLTTQAVSGWKRVNTLAHYGVTDSLTMTLLSSSDKEMTDSSKETNSPGMKSGSDTRLWHLVKPNDTQLTYMSGNGAFDEGMITRLLITKTALLPFIEELFNAVLSTDTPLPPVVKFIFDVLDNAAKRHNIRNLDIVHTWKSNIMLLRFWATIIRRPHLLLDINSTSNVDKCLWVVAQTLIDSSSTSKLFLHNDLPSYRLLFAEELPRYQHKVSDFYKRVRETPPVFDDMMSRSMTDMSEVHLPEVNIDLEVKAMQHTCLQYSSKLVELLNNDSEAMTMHLTERFSRNMQLRP